MANPVPPPHRVLFLLVSLPLAAGVWAAYAAQSGPLKDENGIEFALPKDWPAGHPLPNRLTNCVRCHIDKGGALSESVHAFAGSTHDFEQLECATCHGGDTKDDEKAHEGDFISGALSKLMERCEGCHKTESRVFKESAHYSKPIKASHPICSTCHDNHSAGAAPRQIANACAECHGTRAEATTGEGESQIVWRSRVKGEAGNGVAIAMTAGAPGQAFSVEKQSEGEGAAARTRLTIRLATGPDGKSTTLASEVLDALRADKELYYILQAEEGGESLGEGIVEPAEFTLSGGAGFGEKYPAFLALAEANGAMWDSLAALRRNREAIPEDLNEAISAARTRSMKMFHASPASPEAAAVEELLRETRDLKTRIDRRLAGGPGEPREGKP